MSQCANVFVHMKEHGSITPLEAFKRYGILALHSRIAELRERGHKIVTRMVETESGKRVGQYSLERKCYP